MIFYTYIYHYINKEDGFKLKGNSAKPLISNFLKVAGCITSRKVTAKIFGMVLCCFDY